MFGVENYTHFEVYCFLNNFFIKKQTKHDKLIGKALGRILTRILGRVLDRVLGNGIRQGIRQWY